MDAHTLLFLLAALAGLTILIPIGCALYLRRNVDRRLLALEQAVHAQATPAPARSVPRRRLKALARLSQIISAGPGQSNSQTGAAQQRLLVESLTGEFGLLHEKLNLMGGAERALRWTPLLNWTFEDYRAEYDRLKAVIHRESTGKSGRPIYFVDEHAGEIRLAAETAKAAHESGLMHFAAEAWPHVVLLVPQMLTLQMAMGLYLPGLIALMHYIEAQHVRTQMKILVENTRYLIDIHEDANEATLRHRWRSARDLLSAPNLADARMQLRRICSDLVVFRYREMRAAVRQFSVAVQAVRGKPFSEEWMHSCLRTLDRLKDAIVLECFIRIALSEEEILLTEILKAEKEEVHVALAECRNIVQARLSRVSSKRLRLYRYLRTAPMRLKAYSGLLDFIGISLDAHSRAALPTATLPRISHEKLPRR